MHEATLLERCRVCDSSDFAPVLDLGKQPWCNHFLREEELGTEPFYPLRVIYCHACATVQLDCTVPKQVMFGDHTYLSGVTRSLSEHFRSVAAEVDEHFFSNVAGKSVLDIGSNDGTQLKHYKSLGYDVVGVESARTPARIAQESGIETVHDFFDVDLARQLDRRFHVVNAAGVFFHLEELHSVTEGIRESLRGEGVFVVQFLYMKRIVENGAFDQIYHEHLLYYNVETVDNLLQLHGLSLFDAYLSPIHGGSIIGFAGHTGAREPSDRLRSLKMKEYGKKSNELITYLEFSDRIHRLKEENLNLLNRAKDEGKTIFGLGAPAKGNTLLNFFGVGKQFLDCLTEKNELRRGLYSPGMHLPIVLERELPEQPDLYYVLAWNFKREILENNQGLLNRGVDFYFPIDPEEKIT